MTEEICKNAEHRSHMGSGFCPACGAKNHTGVSYRPQFAAILPGTDAGLCFPVYDVPPPKAAAIRFWASVALSGTNCFSYPGRLDYLHCLGLRRVPERKPKEPRTGRVDPRAHWDCLVILAGLPIRRSLWRQRGISWHIFVLLLIGRVCSHR